jgi:hypothetical protein
MLSEWYLFTLNNPLYAAALATAVWLLTSIIYSIRIAAIKRGHVASEKAGIENLAAVQQQLQHSQVALAETTVQMEKATSAAQDETQRALTLEQLIYQRNKQIAETIQTLATSFDLGERPLLATEDVKADLLWQQHAKIITQLIDRLRAEQQAKIALQQTCQAETAKLAEKELLLEALQTTLATHANQLSKLEQTLAEQQTILQQQDNAQQALSDTLKHYQPTVSRPAEPERETVQPVIQLEASPAAVEPLIAQPAPYSPVIHVNEEPQIVDSRSFDATPIESVTAVEAAPVQSDIKAHPAIEETPYVSLDLEQQPVTPAKGSFGKIKNLFGKKQSPVKTEPQWADTTSAEQEAHPSSPDTQQQPADDASEKAGTTPGKLKGFYSKFKSKGK